jgi:hypothetical protein
MFDLRYHVASLAAVFVALIVGILVGVGLAGSGVTKEADLRVARSQRDDAQRDLDAAKAQLQEQAKTQKAFEIAYPRIMESLLIGKRFAVLFVGPRDGSISQAIEDTFSDAGAAPSAREISLSVPVDAQNLDNVLFNKGPQFVKYVGNDKLESLGDALGTEFASGGQTPLWRVLGRQLIGERNGNTRQRVDGVVVARTVKPQAGDTARFLHGLYAGLTAAGVPVVGVEKSGTATTAVKVYRDRGLSAIDDIDLATGRVALALVLAGAAAGSYGTAKGADAVLPTPPSG